MAKVLDVASQVAAGLQHLHARHIVHGGARPLTPHAWHALVGCCLVAAHMISNQSGYCRQPSYIAPTYTNQLSLCFSCFNLSADLVRS